MCEKDDLTVQPGYGGAQIPGFDFAAMRELCIRLNLSEYVCV